MGEETKAKLSGILKGKKWSQVTKNRIKKNHSNPIRRKFFNIKESILIKGFRSSKDAGEYAVNNGMCSYGWCGRSLATREEARPTRDYSIGGLLFVY